MSESGIDGTTIEGRCRAFIQNARKDNNNSWVFVVLGTLLGCVMLAQFVVAGCTTTFF
ncbi:MAG TPA: hypothetical protein VJ729_00790 [Nitrososphaeraceae archaeon]|nr:hypothetical protein [Nitrososphaeraceae archaeon]